MLHLKGTGTPGVASFQRQGYWIAISVPERAGSALHVVSVVGRDHMLSTSTEQKGFIAGQKLTTLGLYS